MTKNASIKIKRLAGSMGAEISGVDLSQPLANEQLVDIHQAFLDHLMIYFRDQQLDEAALEVLGETPPGNKPQPAAVVTGLRVRGLARQTLGLLGEALLFFEQPFHAPPREPAVLAPIEQLGKPAELIADARLLGACFVAGTLAFAFALGRRGLTQIRSRTLGRFREHP